MVDSTSKSPVLAALRETFTICVAEFNYSGRLVLCRHIRAHFAGLTGLSALQGNLALAGLTGVLGAFLAFQVHAFSLLQPCICTCTHAWPWPVQSVADTSTACSSLM